VKRKFSKFLPNSGTLKSEANIGELKKKILTNVIQLK
jgi:hypothetical protein